MRGEEGIAFKGIISEGFPYQNIAKEYEKREHQPYQYLQNLTISREWIFISEISSTVNIPVLRKDFIVTSIRFMNQDRC